VKNINNLIKIAFQIISIVRMTLAMVITRGCMLTPYFVNIL